MTKDIFERSNDWKENILDANGINRWGDLTRKINKLHPSTSTFGRES